MREIMERLNQVLEFELLHFGKFSLTVGVLVTAFLIILFTRLVLWGIKKLLFRKRNLTQHERGNLYSVYQIIQYLVWIIAILVILESLGLRLNALLAGSAALLVGIGLGLQNTFNDFISGIILLFEGSVRVGDILEIDHDLLKITNIGLRTSQAINRDDIVSIIPNSLITNSQVINWSHQSKNTRFRIKVGVAYGSDVDLVERLLVESASEHPEVEKENLISSRFLDFGNSSLDFELLFFTKNVFRVENVKSDIRRTINRKFIEQGVTIPFPQVDVHFRNAMPGGDKTTVE